MSADRIDRQGRRPQLTIQAEVLGRILDEHILAGYGLGDSAGASNASFKDLARQFDSWKLSVAESLKLGFSNGSVRDAFMAPFDQHFLFRRVGRPAHGPQPGGAAYSWASRSAAFACEWCTATGVNSEPVFGCQRRSFWSAVLLA